MDSTCTVIDLHGYSDKGGIGDRVVIHGQDTYCQTIHRQIRIGVG